MMKRIVAAGLFVTSQWLDRAAKWCKQRSLRLLGFNFAIPPPAPTNVEIVAGCLDCGSMFAVKAEFDVHQCPKRKSS